jgi:hypothetical protein
MRRPDGVYVWVDWDKLIDKQKFDGWDFVIDVAGAGGQLLAPVGGPVGIGAFIVSEGAEFVGAAKATLDLIHGKPANASMFMIQKTAPVAIDWLRLHPTWGIFFNGISIGINVIPAVRWDAIHVIQGGQ